MNKTKLPLLIFCISALTNCGGEASKGESLPVPTHSATEQEASDNLPPQRAFPQNINTDTVELFNLELETVNQDVADFYQYWKSTYITAAETGGYYVSGPDTNGTAKGTSESHGYGMLITVLMAQTDGDEKAIFDGLLDFYESHRSTGNEHLMGWFIDSNESGSGTYYSATDGDMDIAYALLLAHNQWGSKGEENYLDKAIAMIESGILVSDYSSESARLLLGDWDTNPYTSRTSDWMPSHLLAYYEFTSNNEWLLARENIANMLETLNTYNKGTGLLPDFVYHEAVRPDDINANLTGEINSQHYYYNAARVPLRLGVDCLHTESESSCQQVQMIAKWVAGQLELNADFLKLRSGYAIDGSHIAQSQYPSSTFISPFVMSLAINSDHLNFRLGWNVIKDRQESYFGDTINLLTMLALSGNWWPPKP